MVAGLEQRTTAAKSSPTETFQQLLSETGKSGNSNMRIFLRNTELNTRKTEGIWKG